MSVLFIFLSVGSFLLYQGTSGVDTEEVSVMEGDSVTLNTGVEKTQQDRMKWYFKDIRIALITGDQSKICTDDQCDERFRDRLKLDHQTGSLTITNTRTTDSGEYKLKISSSNSEKIFRVTILDKVSVMEGDSVTLHTDVKKTQEDRMKWYFNDIHIAQITGDQSKTCTDVQCNEGTERFRDRLKLDNQTGSLTIINTRTTDSGEYKLELTSRSSLRRNRRSISISSVKSFSVSVIAVPDSGQPSGAVAGIVVAVVLLVFVAAAAAVIYRRHRIFRNEQGVIEESFINDILNDRGKNI